MPWVRLLTGHPIAKVGDIPKGTMIGVQLNGQKVLVANVDGEFFAMRSVCNHMGGSLDKGTLEGNVVTCPLHGSKWDVKTGRLIQYVRPLPPEPVYKTSLAGEEVIVET